MSLVLGNENDASRSYQSLYWRHSSRLRRCVDWLAEASVRRREHVSPKHSLLPKSQYSAVTKKNYYNVIALNLNLNDTNNLVYSRGLKLHLLKLYVWLLPAFSALFGCINSLISWQRFSVWSCWTFQNIVSEKLNIR